MSEEIAENKSFGPFKLMAGGHAEKGKFYSKGDVFESTSDLLKHNTVGYPPRFILADNVAVKNAESITEDDEDGFEEMTLKELKDWASEGDIDLEGCGNNKRKIIEKLKASSI